MIWRGGGYPGHLVKGLYFMKGVVLKNACFPDFLGKNGPLIGQI